MAMQTLVASKQLRDDLSALRALDASALGALVVLASDQVRVRALPDSG